MSSSPATGKSAGPLRNRRVAIGLAGLGLSVVVFLILTARWFLFPNTTVPEQADAVVVLAGGKGERITRALELMDPPTAPTLVLSVGDRQWSGWSALEPFCQEPPEFEVVCVDPVPDSTKGEAQTISRLAEERGWQSIALVTSEFHLHRATLRFQRCFDGEIFPVAAPADRTISAITHEWLGTIEARLLDPGC